MLCAINTPTCADTRAHSFIVLHMTIGHHPGKRHRRGPHEGSQHRCPASGVACCHHRLRTPPQSKSRVLLGRNMFDSSRSHKRNSCGVSPSRAAVFGRNPIHVAPQVAMHLGAGVLGRTEREPERRGQVRFWLAGLGPRRARHVEQIVLLGHLKVQGGAGQPVRPGRGARMVFGPMLPMNTGGPPDRAVGGPTGRTASSCLPPTPTLTVNRPPRRPGRQFVYRRRQLRARRQPAGAGASAIR